MDGTGRGRVGPSDAGQKCTRDLCPTPAVPLVRVRRGLRSEDGNAEDRDKTLELLEQSLQRNDGNLQFHLMTAPELDFFA